jgi:predicted XRE-type DNA-binding protein
MQQARRKVTRSRTNVFRDLGFASGEAGHLLIRADLMIQIEKVLKARGLRQAEAARIMRVTQPRVSDLLRGKIDLFSTDTLIDMLARLGVRVRLVTSPVRSHRAA